jgi:hypothetical protein
VSRCDAAGLLQASIMECLETQLFSRRALPAECARGVSPLVQRVWAEVVLRGSDDLSDRPNYRDARWPPIDPKETRPAGKFELFKTRAASSGST